MIIGRKGSAGEVTRVDGPFWPLDVTYYTSHDESRIDFGFLQYALSILDLPSLARGVKPGINRNDVYSLPIPLPPLKEQKRIVAVLDRAFAALDRARAHAEANLADAEALYENYLAQVFSEGGEEWSPCSVGDVITLQRGFDITKNDQRDGTVPVVSSGGAKSFHDEAKANAPGVVIGRKGSIGSVYFITEEFWPHDTTLFVKDFKGNDPQLVFYLLKGLKLAELDTGAANPSLNRNLVHPLSIMWPSADHQKAVADRLQHVENSTQLLRAKYSKKMAMVADLRQSLLQKAFTGQLTA